MIVLNHRPCRCIRGEVDHAVNREVGREDLGVLGDTIRIENRSHDKSVMLSNSR